MAAEEVSYLKPSDREAATISPLRPKLEYL